METPPHSGLIKLHGSPPPPIPGQVSFLTLFPSIMLPIFLALIDQTIVSTALPAITQALGGAELLSWIVVAYLVAVTISAPVFGMLGDQFGRRRLLLVALPIVAGASVLCALAPTVELLIAARFLQGLGGGALLALCHALIGETVPPRERGRYQGYIAAVSMTASMFGPVVGGFLSEQVAWQAVFYINLPIAAASALLVLRLPHRRSSPETAFRFDFGGLALFAVFVFCMLIALEQVRNPMSMSVPLVAGLFATALLILPLFIRHQRRRATPLVPVTLLRTPAIWRSNALAALHGASLISLTTFVPLYFYAVRGASPTEAGLMMVPMTVGIGIGSSITGQVISRTGYTAIMPSMGLLFASLVLLALSIASPGMPNGMVVALLALTTLFMGSVMAVVQVTVQHTAGPGMLGRAAASVQLSRSLGSAVGTACVGTIIFMVLYLSRPDAIAVFVDIMQQGHASPSASVDVRHVIALAFSGGFLTVASFAAAGSALAWCLPLRRV